MADKAPKLLEKDVLINEAKSDLPPQGPSNIIKVTTKRGKVIVDLLTRMPPAKISDFIQEHDRAIPRRDVVVQPGRKGIALLIDPNSDDEIYEINTIEDSLKDVIKLTGTKKESAAQIKQTVQEQKEKDDQPKKE